MTQEYAHKRDFTKTPEPSPGQQVEGKGPLTFVVHKHSASRLHYDLRLELDGVLKSWAIPAGPSYDPAKKRLAVHVEDHPLDYGSFEGVIPEGEYGAGQVIIWDQGTYAPETKGTPFFDNRETAEELMNRDLAAGKIAMVLRGHKLHGKWELVQMRGGKNWLFIKHRDDAASPDKDILKEDASVVSGLTINDLKAGALPNEPTPHADPANLDGAKKAPFPQKMAPMLATISDKPFSDPDWFFEPKVDGYRAISMIQNGKVRLLSRRGLDISEKYDLLIKELSTQQGDIVLDGEIVMIDTSGKICFQCLQNYALQTAGTEKDEPHHPLYYVFDILFRDGYDLTGVSYLKRRQVLESILTPGHYVKLIDNFPAQGKTVYTAAVEQGMEGVIAKQKDSVYQPGRRSASWLKIKSNKSDDFVVGGYTSGTGNRSRTFGSLLLGSYDGQNNLIYVGNVGSGFDDETLTMLKKRLEALTTQKQPFKNSPTQQPGIRWSRLNNPIKWAQPEIVVEVKFAEQTKEGFLRAPVFLRVREEKEPSEVQVTTGDPGNKKPPVTDTVSAIEDILEQLNSKNKDFNLVLEGNSIPITHLDKPLWPATKNHREITKRDFLVYLAAASPFLLPHLKDRPLTLSRYPDGINGQHFWQRHWGKQPDYIDEATITLESEGVQEFLVCNNLSALLWLGQLADLELHVWFSRVVSVPDRPNAELFSGYRDIPDFNVRYPDFIIFDIDPYIYSGSEAKGAEPDLNREGFELTNEAARWLKETLDRLNLSAFVKTSGKTGVHIYVPIQRQFNYDEVRAAARTICSYVHEQHPDETTLEWKVEKRQGKIFLDFNQNSFGKTLASAYSPRPNPEAGVSLPLFWDELGKFYPAEYNLLTTSEFLKQRRDPWAKILDTKHDLKNILGDK